MKHISTFFEEHSPVIDNVQWEIEKGVMVEFDVMRLDLLHPQISGNKWYKIKYQLQDAMKKGAQSVLSFGGAYSNHLHALAYAGFLSGIKTIGIIRGEQVQNQTLVDCHSWGMEIHFVDRKRYRKKTEDGFLHAIHQMFPESYLIPEGGGGELGIKGCQEILFNIGNNYNHIFCSVGTGTTLAGLIRSVPREVIVHGMVVLKNGSYLQDEICNWVSTDNWQLHHNYHFNGFAKISPALIQFMQEFQMKTGIELDRVYTAKMMFGILDLITSKKLDSTKRILAIHTGGLQGNRSLQTV